MNTRPMSLLEYCFATATAEGRADEELAREETAPILNDRLAAPEARHLPIPSALERAPTRHLLRSGSVL